MCKFRTWKVEKNVVTLGLLHVVTDSFQGGCLKQAQKIVSKKVRNVVLFMAEQIKTIFPCLQQLMMENLLCHPIMKVGYFLTLLMLQNSNTINAFWVI